MTGITLYLKKHVFYNSACDVRHGFAKMPLGKFLFSKENLRIASSGSNSKFDELLQSSWIDRQKKGFFRYDLSEMKTRVLPGKCAFLLQINKKRGSNRRKPQQIRTLEQKPQKGEFNFCQIDEEKEGLMEIEDESNSRTLILINVSPLEFGNSLLIPEIEQLLPQVVSQAGLEKAICCVLASNQKNFKVFFNSLCAFASVNHQVKKPFK